MKKSGKKTSSTKGDRRRLAAVIAACAAVAVVAVMIHLASADTVRIRDWHDLHQVRHDLTGSYVLMNDLDSTTAGYRDLAGPTANDGKGWEPIGQAQFLEDGIVGEPFRGTFDGRGHEIRDVFMARPDENTVGLFGILGEEGAVRNVGATGVNVTGHAYVGALAAANLGAVSNSYSTGSVRGHSGVGGLVGVNSHIGTVSSSYSTAGVSGHMVAGGLLGFNSQGIVTDCYATGDVSRSYGSDASFGGFVGRNRGAKIINCFSTGSVDYQGEALPAVNGFAGTIVAEGGYEMTGNCWDIETSGHNSSAGEARGRTTAEMMGIGTYDDWSIVAVNDPGRRNTSYTWNIVDGETYPFLSWQRRS